MKALLLRILERLLPRDWAPDVVADLDEEHARRRARSGRPSADLWLAGQLLLFVVRFGVEALREATPTEAWRERTRSLATELRLTLRSLRRSPLFLGTVVLTLGAGLGVNGAIFALLRTVVLEPLPYPESERLVVLAPNTWVPAAVLRGLDGEGRGLEALSGYYPHRFTVTGGERPEEMEGAMVTADFLPLLGAEMALGRGFTGQDDPAREAVLSHGAWQRRFGGRRDVLGQEIRLDGAPHVIVGVTAEGFRQLTPRADDPEVWTHRPLDRLGEDVLPEGSPPWAIPLARLSADGGPAAAEAALSDAAARYVRGAPEVTPGPRWDLRWTPLRDDLVGDVRTPLLVLQWAVLLVLVLACVNVANLLLVRLQSRRGEMAVRTALGASRGRIVRQLLVESMVLAGLGGLLALALTVWGLEAVRSLAPADLPRLGELSVGPSVVLSIAGATVAVGLLLGVVPGLLSAGLPSHRTLKEGSRTSSGSRRTRRLNQALVVGEITLTLILVVSAGLLSRSFMHLAAQDPGFRSEDVLAVRMSAPEHRYGTVPLLERYQTELLQALRGVPGVQAAGLANNLPSSRISAIRSYVIEGETEPREAQYGVVSPGYFEALHVPIVRGRAFRADDTRESPKVAIVDQAMAREAWPDESPLGKRFRLTDSEEWRTVVGVSADIRGGGLARASEPGFHIPHRQRPDTPVELAVGKDMVVLARVAEGAGLIPSALREAVWSVDAGQPVPEIVPLQAVLDASTRPQRFRATLLAIFAALALLLAVAGVYGVVANLLEERTREFGIRRALGATRADVMRSVMGWGLRLTALGVLLGLAGVLWAGRLLSSLLFGVGAADPPTLVLGVVTVAAVAMLASLIPAWRATRIEALSVVDGA